MTWFDPNSSMQFAPQAADIERQRKLAEMLRKQVQAPEGQMVSGHFVKPSWTQYLAPLLAAYQSGKINKDVNSAESGLVAEQSKQASKWRSALPQATAAVPQQTEPYMAPGIDGPENIPGTSTVTQAAQPAKPITRDAILKYTLAGMQNPMTAKEAPLVNEALTSDLTRAEDKTFKDEQARIAAQEKSEARKETAQLRLQELESRLQDRALDRESRERMAAEALALRRELGTATLELRRELAADKKETNELLKRLPAAQATAYLANETALGNIDDALAKVDKSPSAFGVKGMLPNVALTRLDPAGIEARAAVANLGSLKIHDRSGAAVTAAETPRLVPFIPVPGDDAASVKKKLAGFKREYNLMQDNIRSFAESQNYIVPQFRAPAGGKVVDFGSLK
jgi:hypothetical protein